VEPLDLMTFDPAPFAGRGIDTILCFNVLEHVEDDRGALRRLHAALAPGGRLLLLVPAHQRLYGAIDRAIDHYRRYDAAGLAATLEEAGFRVEHTQYFNRLGVLGWYLNSVLLRRTKVPGLQLRLQNVLVPFLRAEAALPLPFGLSLIAVARRA
jgi:SAM-dependent methyltransferase